MLSRSFKMRRIHKSGYDYQSCGQRQADSCNKTALKRLHQHRAALKQETDLSSLPRDLSNPPTKLRHELMG